MLELYVKPKVARPLHGQKTNTWKWNLILLLVILLLLLIIILLGYSINVWPFMINDWTDG